MGTECVHVAMSAGSRLSHVWVSFRTAISAIGCLVQHEHSENGCCSESFGQYVQSEHHVLTLVSIRWSFGAIRTYVAKMANLCFLHAMSINYMVRLL
jgi:hypothetical protein